MKLIAKNDILGSKRLFQYFRIAPDVATYSGINDFDSYLPPQNEGYLRHKLDVLKSWVANIETKVKDASQADDFELFRNQVKLYSFGVEEVKSFKKNPDPFSEIDSIIFTMLLKSYGSEEERFTNIISRLNALPLYLHDFKGRISPKICRLWRDIAIEVAQSTPVLLVSVLESAKGKVKSPLLKKLQSSVNSALQEVESFIKWLKNLPVLDKDLWVLGRENFATLVKLRRLPFSVDEILEFGTESLERFKNERKALLKKLTPSGSFKQAGRLLEDTAPRDFASSLKAIRNASLKARDFIASSGLFRIDYSENLKVIETPDFLKPLIPFAALIPPLKCDPGQTSLYLVTRPAKWTGANKSSLPDIRNTSVHEGYPGHHLQLSWANVKTTYLRSGPLGGSGFDASLVLGTELVEGWAHYCESMMKENGFYNSPLDRLMLLNDLIWRAARVVIDVNLSTGVMSFKEAVGTLVKEASMPRAQAVSEVKRYTQSPAYQLSYLVGRHMILNLRRKAKLVLKDKFTDRKFHEFVLNHGTVPASFIEKNIGEIT